MNKSMWDGVKKYVHPLNEDEKEYKDRAEKQLYIEGKIGFGGTAETLERGRMLVRERARKLHEKEL